MSQESKPHKRKKKSLSLKIWIRRKILWRHRKKYLSSIALIKWDSKKICSEVSNCGILTDVLLGVFAYGFNKPSAVQ